MTATHPRARRRTGDGGMFGRRAPAQLLDTPAGRELLARIDAATSMIVAEGLDRDDHVRRIALVCLEARRR